MFWAAVCGIYTVLIGESYIYYSHVPKGSCLTCCGIEEKEDIQFLLYTRNNRNNYYTLYLNKASSLSNSHFDSQKPLKIFLHGFTDSATNNGQSSQKIKDAFLKQDDLNVILIDWSAITAAPWYLSAVENIPTAAEYMAKFIKFLIKQGCPVENIHLIGFSLGAEAAGSIGQKLKSWGITLPRITGLDPAGPFFISNSYISPKIAEFVDIIHTDGGTFGNINALGHADFYVNGGTGLQPGCVKEDLGFDQWLNILSCSHQRAWEYFIESIDNPNAFSVDNGKAFMGMGADKSLRGEFYLETNSDSPYGRG